MPPYPWLPKVPTAATAATSTYAEGQKSMGRGRRVFDLPKVVPGLSPLGFGFTNLGSVQRSVVFQLRSRAGLSSCHGRQVKLERNFLALLYMPSVAMLLSPRWGSQRSPSGPAMGRGCRAL